MAGGLSAKNRFRIAQERAKHRWRCRKLPRRFKEDVRVKVDEYIRKDYSPEQMAIARRT